MTQGGRQLVLLRHAKAVTGGPDMTDFERPLAERGQKAAARMGRYLAEHRLAPDLVLCSPAHRTRETWALAAPALPPAETRLVDELYDFGGGESLLAVIRRDGGNARRLLLVGHNPAIQGLALMLAGSGEAALRRQMAEKYPTAGLSILDFTSGAWASTAAATGTLAGFVRPRDLGAD
jgi:phosphohistidine phosphatase